MKLLFKNRLEEWKPKKETCPSKQGGFPYFGNKKTHPKQVGNKKSKAMKTKTFYLEKTEIRSLRCQKSDRFSVRGQNGFI